MEKVIIAGNDLSEKNMLLKIAVGLAKPVTRSFPYGAKGRRALISFLRRLARESQAGRVVHAYEACGLGFGLHDDLVTAGIESHVLAPTRIERSPKQLKQKNDDKDSLTIFEILRGHVLAGNRLPSVWIPDHQTRDDRELVRARLDVKEKAALVKTQIRTLIKRQPQRVAPPRDTKKGWSVGYRTWLEQLASGRRPFPPGARRALRSLLSQLAFLQQEIDQLDKDVAVLARANRYAGPVRELTRLTGVATLSAMVFLAELGDMARFRNRRQVGAFLGLVPSCHESGEASDRKGHITHQGPPRVSKILCQSTWARIRLDKKIKATAEQIQRGSRKRKKVAAVALMRRLAIRMWHVALEAQQRAGSFSKSGSDEGRLGNGDAAA